MINIFDIHRLLKGKSLGEMYSFEEANRMMPVAYQHPAGRWLHNDHGIMAEKIPSWFPSWLKKAIIAVQPWQKARRVDHTYVLPLPLKLISGWGGIAPEWMPWQEGYFGGMASDIQLRPVPDDPNSLARSLRDQWGKDIRSEVLAYHPIPKPGQGGLFGVEINGKIVPCWYVSCIKIPFFKKQFQYYFGLKPDMTHGDFMLNWPEWSSGIKGI